VTFPLFRNLYPASRCLHYSQNFTLIDLESRHDPICRQRILASNWSMISLQPSTCCVPSSTDHRSIVRFLVFLFANLLTLQLTRCYDDPSYVPSSAFIVQYNMIMAIAARVRPPAQSHYPGVTPSHYTVASATTKPNPSPSDIASRPPSKIPHDQFYNRMLPYFPDLLHEPSLPDLQALLLLMVYLIGIYKMGHLWHLSRIMSAIAYELGLHRSDANWTNFNPLEREMRKRVFFLTVGLDLKVAK
jgi:Fungal specific transcription factor domain